MKAIMKTISLPLLFMAVIFILSSVPGEAEGISFIFMNHLHPTLQNLLHIPLYAILQILWLRSFTRLGKKGFELIFICLVITIGYGIFDEFHQMLVPGRYGSLEDIVLNIIGACLGIGLFLLLQRLMADPLHQ